MELNFREGKLEDKDQLMQLAIISFSQYEKVLSEENWKILYENLMADISYFKLLNIAKYFVCEIRNEIVGVAFIVPKGIQLKYLN